MADNGLNSVNSPFKQATGERNLGAYQEKVYQELSKNGLLTTNIHSIAMTKADFNYGVDTNHTIQFNKIKFDLSKQTTPSKELLKADDKVSYSGAGMRLQPNGKAKLIPTTATDKITILGSPISDNQLNSPNQHAWYPVQMVQNGKTVSGFIASPYIIQR